VPAGASRAAHSRRIVQLTAFGQQGLVEQDLRQIVEARVIGQALDQRMLGVDLEDGLGVGAAWPACLSRRARWALMSPSSTTTQAGESTRRVVTRTSLARPFSASFRRSSTA
jgi:hypothetical protein